MSFHQVCANSIIKKAKRGDKFALTHIYQLYKHPVFNLAYQMLRDEHRANDVLQIVMMKMINSIKSLADSKKLNGWMKRVTYNTVIDVIRNNKKLEFFGDEVSLGYSAEESLETINSDAWDVDVFLDMLSERERLVVWLYAVEGFSHAEIAEKLQISEQNSRVIFSRAMKSLKQLAQNKGFSKVSANHE